MKPQKEILEFGKEKLQQLKTIFEELEVQMALGKKEAKEVFEREKKTLTEFITQQKDKLKEAGEVAEDHRRELINKFNTLEAVLSEDVSTSKRRYDTYKDKVLKNIYELEFAQKQAYGEVRSSIREQLDQFKARLDAYRVQLALSKMDNIEELEARKAEIKEKVAEMREKLQQEEESGGKLNHFVDEVSASFDHMKKAFSDLFQ
jgi:hypothetical protein